MAIVVAMAVPVVAVVGDGSRTGSEQVVVNIQETDSFGGSGFYGDDSNRIASGGEEELYNPGADLGIGVDENGEAANPNARLRSVAGGSQTASLSSRRDKSGVGASDQTVTASANSRLATAEPSDAPRINAPTRVALPKAPTGGFATAGSHNCVINTADAVVAEDAIFIVASGR